MNEAGPIPTTTASAAGSRRALLAGAGAVVVLPGVAVPADLAALRLARGAAR